MGNPVVHFQIPADDLERARRFYEGMFDWRIEAGGSGKKTEYYVISTGGDGPDGDLVPRQAPEHPFLQYVLVDRLDQSVGRVAELGGAVLMERIDVPGQGVFALVQDPEGNVIGLWEGQSKPK